MKNRASLERAWHRELIHCAASQQLPDEQLERERTFALRAFFASSLEERKELAKEAKADSKRREEASRIAVADGEVPANRAIARARGERGYGFSNGGMAIPKSKSRAKR